MSAGHVTYAMSMSYSVCHGLLFTRLLVYPASAINFITNYWVLGKGSDSEHKRAVTVNAFIHNRDSFIHFQTYQDSYAVFTYVYTFDCSYGQLDMYCCGEGVIGNSSMCVRKS